MKRIPSVEALTSARQTAVWRLPVRQYVRRSLDLSGCLRVGRRVAHLSRHLSSQGLQESLQRLSAMSTGASSAAVAAAVLGRAGSSDDNLTFDLDWRPALSQAQEVVCWSCAAALTCLLYAVTAPPVVSVPYGTCMGLVFGLALYLLRGHWLEELYKARERIEADLGDPDSRFRDLGNLLVHVKVQAGRALPPPVAQTPAAARYAPPPAAAAGGRGAVPALHCFHGFGSNTWSWSLVQGSLAARLGALVTSHDMPGFGLTQRPTDLSAYYLAFNGRLGRLAMDYELAIRGLLSAQEAARAGGSGYPHASVHEAAAAAGGTEQQSTVAGLEAAAGGSPAQAAQAAVRSGLEPTQQGVAAAAAQGGVGAALAGAVSAATGQPGTQPSTNTSTSSQAGSSSKVQRVLMGHSLGGACAALEYIANPGDYSAIVLVDPAIIAGVGGPAERDPPGSAISLQKLQDGTAFTRSLASGDAPDASAAAAAANEADSVSARRTSSSSSSSSSADLDGLAAEQGNVTRAASSSSGSDASSSSGDGSGSGLAAAAAAGDVVFYATRGDAASFDSVLKAADPRPANAAVALLGNAVGLVRSFVLLTTMVALSLMRPLIVVLLRMAVRSRKFWANTLQQAYYDKSKVTPAAVDAYRLPQLVRGWEAGMVAFLMARLGAGGTRGATAAVGAAAAAAAGGASSGAAAAGPRGLEDANLAYRFAAAVAERGTPVLIVHGGGDKLIPVSNSFKLARLIRGARLAVVKRAGHCPQEEVPGLFEDVVAAFLGKHLA